MVSAAEAFLHPENDIAFEGVGAIASPSSSGAPCL